MRRPVADAAQADAAHARGPTAVAGGVKLHVGDLKGAAWPSDAGDGAS